MHVQIVVFTPSGMTDQEYLDVANVIAPKLAGGPGLLAKVWLDNPEMHTYGAVYFWEDEESMQRFSSTDLFEEANEDWDILFSQDFSILENLTRATQPGMDILEPALETAAPRRVASERPSAREVTGRKAPALKGKSAKTAKTAGGRKSTAKDTAGAKSAAKKTAAKKTAAKSRTSEKSTAGKSPKRSTSATQAKAKTKSTGRRSR